MIKVKKGFLLRKLSEEYIVVAIGEAGLNFNGMIALNKTGAFYWEELVKGTTEEELVQKTLEYFKDVEEETVRQDVKEFLSNVSIALNWEQS